MNRNIDPQSDTNDTAGHAAKFRPKAEDVTDTEGHMPRIKPKSEDLTDTEGHMPRVRWITDSDGTVGGPTSEGTSDTDVHGHKVPDTSEDVTDTEGHRHSTGRGRIHGAIEEADTEGHAGGAHPKADDLGIQIDP